jgi:hypothetical protein
VQITGAKCANATTWHLESIADSGAKSQTSATDPTCKADGANASTNKLCPHGLGSGKSTNADADCYDKTKECKAATTNYKAAFSATNLSHWKADAEADCVAFALSSGY